MSVITLAGVKQIPEVRHYLDRADSVLEAIGYTEHGRRHASVVAKRASAVMEALDRPARECELAAIAAYLHDIGNVVNRDHHAQSGAVLANHLLRESSDMPIEDVIEIVTAIGHHHETDGAPVSDVAAAVILADKSDVHRSRVRDKAMIQLDIHDRVNYAVTDSALRVVGPRASAELTGEREGNPGGDSGNGKGDGDHAAVTISDVERGDGEGRPTITLALEIDTSIAPVMEYFEIFLPRMLLSNRAAERLGATYKLVINETPLL